MNGMSRRGYVNISHAPRLVWSAGLRWGLTRGTRTQNSGAYGEAKAALPGPPREADANHWLDHHPGRGAEANGRPESNLRPSSGRFELIARVEEGPHRRQEANRIGDVYPMEAADLPLRARPHQ